MNASLKIERDLTGPGFFVEWQIDECSPSRPSPARKVLLVAAEAGAKDLLGGWLASEGHDVIECPGPALLSTHASGAAAVTAHSPKLQM